MTLLDHQCVILPDSLPGYFSHVLESQGIGSFQLRKEFNPAIQEGKYFENE